MRNRLFNFLGIGILYFAASMFFAQTLLFVYFTFAWKIDRDRLSQIVATAQGYDLYKMQEETRKEQIDAIQRMTYDAVLQERANRLLQGDRDQARSGVLEDFILGQIQQVNDQKRQLLEISRNFEKRLADLEKERKSAGFIELVANMSLLKDENAKKQILKMIDDKQEDRVVEIFNAMEEGPRKKLLNAMRADEEVDKLADILRRIGDGEPETRFAKEAKDELLK
ncbi:MAG: hypothetical protein FWC43_12000 [Planctomycetaceae bacterium]|nr:hypothetical protein [Planctomycetaceae bacterium]MCL2306056.1 hypothetical protein [Planctomycetaceae bacterium]